MTTVYVHLDYDAYKELEGQLRQGFEALERTHLTPGCYHKSVRLQAGGIVFEFQGPLVRVPPEVSDGTSGDRGRAAGGGGRP